MSELRIAIVGFGKIARTRHVPVIAGTPGARLVAIADPNPASADVPYFPGLQELLRDGPAFDAVALCTPPQIRSAQAAIALAAGKHVLLEKPPGKSLGEIAPLRSAADAAGRTLFTAWHSQFAAAVEPARQLLASRRIERISVTWKEDVRVWHPGQAWIFQPGGLGVFDPGINALSILTPRQLRRADRRRTGSRRCRRAAGRGCVRFPPDRRAEPDYPFRNRPGPADLVGRSPPDRRRPRAGRRQQRGISAALSPLCRPGRARAQRRRSRAPPTGRGLLPARPLARGRSF